MASHCSHVIDYHLDEDSGCWLWDGEIDDKGYGRVSVGGRTTKAHRWMFEMDKGRPVREGCCVHHKCGNKGCVNPSHLTEATISEHSLYHACRRNRARRREAWPL